MNGLYRLDDHGDPVREPDTIRWAKWYETAQRVVRQEEIGEARVSTVFLGIDHAWGGGLPLLWETMIFGGPRDQWTERHTSRADAIAGHERAVLMVRELTPANRST